MSTTTQNSAINALARDWSDHVGGFKQSQKIVTQAYALGYMVASGHTKGKYVLLEENLTIALSLARGNSAAIKRGTRLKHIALHVERALRAIAAAKEAQ